ncbi:MAG TPA: hypothetical protein VFH39_04440 [Candidatus Saccharimonadales bacterium]|nr:hypothetical protein [Candidatus Saccharimonadales bacterium]
MTHQAEFPYWVEFQDVDLRLPMGTLMVDGYPAGGYEQLATGRVIMHTFLVNQGAGQQLLSHEPGRSERDIERLADQVLSKLVVCEDLEPRNGVVSIPAAREVIEEACGLVPAVPYNLPRRRQDHRPSRHSI